ncbi:MAG: proteasome assembly chaperone family protein [Candidatus Nezhaarchaeota archaeon]|nr:proteasome assembly chaperone family protein [Candidatus Nezhaarchaeota archaeon]
MTSEVEVVESARLEVEGARAIEGLPDVGLVGAIATSYLVETLGVDEVAYVDSELLPPVMVLHKGRLKSPVRIHASGDLLLLVSEIAIPVEVLPTLVKALTSWFKEKHVELMISLGGIPVPNRLDIETPAVYGVPNSDEAARLLRERGVEVMEEGFIAGAYALFLKEALRHSIPALALLAQSYLQYPDPGAAAATIEALGKIIGRRFDVKSLLEKAEEIRLKARDLMKQARAAMLGMQKARESEVPLMYT